jgi:hypothetical protein
MGARSLSGVILEGSEMRRSLANYALLCFLVLWLGIGVTFQTDKHNCEKSRGGVIELFAPEGLCVTRGMAAFM